MLRWDSERGVDSGGVVADEDELDSRAETDKRRWSALALCLIAGFMTLLDVSIVNVALPSIQRGLEASSAELSWVISGYALSFGLVLVPAGRMGDDLGRSRMFVIALALFTVASGLAGLAPTGWVLVIARLLQGVSGGLLNPQVLGLMQQLFHGRQRARAFGLFGAVVGISTAIGPLLGGVIIEIAGPEQGWRWVFLVNIPIGLGALLFASVALPPNIRQERLPGLDVVGVLLLAAALLCLLFPLVSHEAGTALMLLMLGAPVFLVAFAFWERRYHGRGYAPLIRFELFRLPTYLYGCAIGLLYFAGFTSIFFVLTLYFQQGLGYSALEAGLVLTPFAVGSAISSGLSGRIVPSWGRRLVLLGLGAALIGLVVTDLVLRAGLGAAAGPATAVPLLFAGLGSGLVIAPNQTVTLSEIDTTYGGIAAGVQQTSQRVGSALGIATSSGLFFATLSTSGYDAAISTGLIASVCFVAAALVVGLTEVGFARR